MPKNKADAEIGLRAAEFVDNLPGKLFPKCLRIGISEVEYRDWKRGRAPLTARAIRKLAESGADVTYILTGRRITE